MAAGLDASAEELVHMGRVETQLTGRCLQEGFKRSSFGPNPFIQELLSGERLDATIDHADEA